MNDTPRSTKTTKELTVGILNCKESQKDFEKTALAQDFERYHLDVIAIQETHVNK